MEDSEEGRGGTKGFISRVRKFSVSSLAFHFTPFSPGIWYNHRKYCDKVPVKTSQRTSARLYVVSELIMSAEQ
jgi:hypothetical protein